MLNLDDLREELVAVNPEVEALDTTILALLETKDAVAVAYEEAKAAVREVKAIRDPLREQQMLLQKVIGDIDPDTPDSQTIDRGEPADHPDAQVVTPDDVAVVELGGE
jgi:chorismate mutase